MEINNTINYYRKKPVIIEAIRWTGKNDKEVEDFIGDSFEGYGNNLVGYYLEGEQYRSKILYIKTLEGTMSANVDDYIIKGVQGEFYPCKPNIFNETYELM